MAFAVALMMQPDPAALVPLYEQALRERQKQYGAYHPKVARSSSDLGLYLRKLGDRRAPVFLRQALEIDERAYGENHSVVAEDLENLASVSPPAEAMTLHSRAARSTDPKIAARNLARLAALQQAAGDREAALASYRQALSKEEAGSGSDHPRVAAHLNDIALLVDPKDAEPLLRRALAIRQKSLGGEHPESAVTMSNLANVLLAGGKLIEAERLQRQALRVLENALGTAHPRVATSASNLADVLRAKRDFAGAKRLYERALAIDEKAYGPDHAEVAADRENLASLLEDMGDKAGARRVRAQ
jgi:tetratricopeptide (TPR) repeat protein